MRRYALLPIASLLALAGCAVDSSAPGSEDGATNVAEAPTPASGGHKLFPIVLDDEARARALTVDPHGDASRPHVEATAVSSRTVRPTMTPVKDQGGRDTCTSFASAALIEHYTRGDISEQCEVHDSGGEGGQVFYRIKDFLTKGAVDERLCTYDGWNGMSRHVPPNMTYAQLVARSTFRLTDLEEVANNPSDSSLIGFLKGQIDAGNPVAGGITVIDGALSSSATYVPYMVTCGGYPLTDSRASCAGHAIVFTGYDDLAQMIEFKNSWGTGWGNGGYGWLSYEYLRRFRSGPFVTLRPHAYRSHESSTEPVYVNTFGREPQSWEVDAWETNLTSNGWTIAAMRSAFLANAQTDDAINGVYQGIFGRTPAAWEVSAWKTNLTSNGWTIPSMRSAFRNNSQHTDAIAKVFADVWGRAPSQPEVSSWLTTLATDANTITTMRIGFADDGRTRTAIDGCFRSVLGRAATRAELDDNQLSIRDFGWSIPQLCASLAAPPIIVR